MANASTRSLAQIGREFSNFCDCQSETGRSYSAQRLSAPHAKSRPSACGVCRTPQRDPDGTIEQRARSADIDLVVVGHRTLTRVHRWFEGKSTAEGLVSSAQTSVLVIPELEDAP